MNALYTRRLYWLVLSMLVLLAVTVSWAAAPEAAAPAASTPETAAPTVPVAASARRDANLIRVNGRPTVLTWAYGLTNAADLDAYTGAGLNTLALTVTSRADDTLTQAFDLATAAEEHGLLVVGVLAPDALKGPTGDTLPIDARNADYVNAVNAFVQTVTARLDRHPRLIAWMAAAVPPDQVVTDNAGFRAFALGLYSSLAALNRSWGSSYSSPDQITMNSAIDVDGGRPSGLGRARLDLAAYRQKAYTDAMEIWAKAIRQASPGKLVLAGALNDYRSMISLGTDFDGLVAGTTPAVAEPDFDTSNVQAVDIARRGNQFIAIQTLDLSSGPSPGRFATWYNLALLHGASGIAIGSWPLLKSAGNLSAELKQGTQALAQSHWFPATPAPRAAILYEPFAGGASRFGHSLYGYLDGTTPDEPTALFTTFRGGSRYGLVDVLSLDSLRADLHRYGTVFAPEAFLLPDDAQLALNQFVLQGGALVADLGIGMYQGDGTVNSLPDIIRDTLGLRYAGVSEQATPTQPTVATQSTPGQGTPVEPGTAGKNVNPQVAALAEWVQQMLQGPEADRFLGSQFVGPGGQGMRINGLGRGFTVFAPFFLYQQWSGGSTAFADFHNRVLAWGSDLRVAQPNQVWPPVAAAAYRSKAVGLAAPTGSAAAVRVGFAPNQVYLVPGGATQLPNPGTDDHVILLFPGRSLAVADLLPITVAPVVAGAIATVVVDQYDANRIDLSVYGAGAVSNPSGGAVVVSGGAATPMRIEIRSGIFPITPGDMYHVTLTEGGKQVGEETMMPDRETGAITLQGNYQRARIVVERAA